MTSESASQSASQELRPGRIDDVPDRWDERAILIRFLDYARDTVHAKCAGLSDADARRAPLPGSPLMTISGLVSHLRWVECAWIDKRFLGAAIDAPWTDEDPDREFRIAVEIPLAQLLAEYQATCERHRRLVAAEDLDAPCRGDLGRRTDPFPLRWVLFHLTEETARHNGHIDILRELADGTRGI
ncbi:MAG TPA: DinB family protein [Trebonia sp.]|nr:DinB family protein [Trebonia sp.]